MARWIRVFVAVLGLLSLMISMTGCSTQYVYEEYLAEYVEPRSLEEIKETGITPQDVLTVFDQFATVLARQWFGDEGPNTRASFVSIQPDRHYVWDVVAYEYNGKEVDRYFTYDKADFANPGVGHYWQSPAIVLDKSEYKIWYTSCTIDFVEDFGKSVPALFRYNYEQRVLDGMVVSYQDFEPVMELFGAEKLQMTEEFVNSFPDGTHLKHGIYYNRTYFRQFLDHGDPLYVGFQITRETILNITDQDLLWALYNMVSGSYYRLNVNAHYNTVGSLDIELENIK